MTGCVVAELGVPALTSRATLGLHVGCTVLEQHVLELAPGGSAPRSTGECEEVLFVLSGRGSLRLGGTEHALEPESGAYLAPGESYELRNPGDEPLRLVAVSIPDPPPPGTPPRGPAGGPPPPPPEGPGGPAPPRVRVLARTGPGRRP